MLRKTWVLSLMLLDPEDHKIANFLDQREHNTAGFSVLDTSICLLNFLSKWKSILPLFSWRLINIFQPHLSPVCIPSISPQLKIMSFLLFFPHTHTYTHTCIHTQTYMHACIHAHSHIKLSSLVFLKGIYHMIS